MTNLRNSKKIAIIGAGPAGLSAAYLLSKEKIDIDLYEAGSSVGGMAKSIKLWDQIVDLGPHRFFSSDPRVNSLWLEVINNDYSMVNRLTRIYYKNTFFDYPLKLFNALWGLGFIEAIRCALSYLYSRVFPPKNISTFEGWVTSRFGSRLFSIFFKSYSEKLWGITCKELDSEFASQRIKKLSLFEAVKAAIIGNRKSKHKTLVDEFAYPNLGAGEVYNLMAQKIQEYGGQILLNRPIDFVTPGKENHKPTIHLESGEQITYDHIISSMPITLLVQKMNPPKDVLDHVTSLKFRNTILVYLLVEGSVDFPDQWIYVHSDKLKTGRITNFSNWVPSINNNQVDTILCLEYWCYDSDKIWEETQEALIDLASHEISETGLIGNNSIKEGKVIRVPRCYPVYASGYKKHLKPVEEFLAKQDGLSVIGRYGSFKYNNQDHSILMGILAYENIFKNKSHNLWELNTDYEYQESSTITATGLSKE